MKSAHYQSDWQGGLARADGGMWSVKASIGKGT